MSKRLVAAIFGIPLFALVLSFAAGLAYVFVPKYSGAGPLRFWRGDASAWADFGTYMGGVAGPLATIVGLLLTVLTLVAMVETLQKMQEQASISLYLAGVQRAQQQIDNSLQRTVSLPLLSYQKVTVEQLLERRSDWNKAVEERPLAELGPHLSAMNAEARKLADVLYFHARTIGAFTKKYAHHAFSVSVEREECVRLAESFIQIDGLAGDVAIKVIGAGAHLGLKLQYTNKLLIGDYERRARERGLPAE